MNLLARVLLILLLLSSPVSAKGLVVIGWDGAGMNNVKQMMDAGKLPNLKSFLNAGGRLCPVEIHARTNTATEWSVLWTGLSYDQTGVLGIRSYEKWIRRQGAIDRPLLYDGATSISEGTNFWVRNIPYKDTILDDLQAAGVKIGWFVSKRLLGRRDSETPLSRIAQNADDFLLSEPNRKHPESYLERLTEAAIRFIGAHKDFMVFIHLDPDDFGHWRGENSPEYLDHIRLCDRYLGKVLAAIAPDTRVIVTADHGFDEGARAHKNAADGWMVTTLPVYGGYGLKSGRHRAFATIRDLAPTILQWFGIDWALMVPELRGKSLL